MGVWCGVSLLLITIVTPCDSSLKNYLAYMCGVFYAGENPGNSSPTDEIPPPPHARAHTHTHAHTRTHKHALMATKFYQQKVIHQFDYDNLKKWIQIYINCHYLNELIILMLLDHIAY